MRASRNVTSGARAARGLFARSLSGRSSTDPGQAAAGPGGLPLRHPLAPIALAMAGACALALGLTNDDAEDCAMEFVLQVLIVGGERLMWPPNQEHVEEGGYNQAWLRRCALNHARDWHRRLRRGQTHEQGWPDAGAVGGDLTLSGALTDAATWESPDPSPGAESILLQAECRQQLLTGLACLGAEARDLLVRHHMAGEAVQDLATGSGRTIGATDQALWRARGRLKAILERQGVAAEDLLAGLAAPEQSETI